MNLERLTLAAIVLIIIGLGMERMDTVAADRLITMIIVAIVAAAPITLVALVLARNSGRSHGASDRSQNQLGDRQPPAIYIIGGGHEPHRLERRD